MPKIAINAKQDALGGWNATAWAEIRVLKGVWLEVSFLASGDSETAAKSAVREAVDKAREDGLISAEHFTS